MRHDVIQTVFQMHALVRRQLLDGADAGPPFPGRPDRPRHEAAAAVRAYVVQLGLDAVRAEGAFVSADPRLHRIRRQVLVAIFAVRSELQRHGRLTVFGLGVDPRFLVVRCRALGATSPLVGEVGSHRRCDPSEGLRTNDRPEPLIPTLPHKGRGSSPSSLRHRTNFQPEHRKSNAGHEWRITLDFGHVPRNYRCDAFSGSFALSFSLSSTIDERTCATLWCGISTLLTMSDMLSSYRSITLC